MDYIVMNQDERDDVVVEFYRKQEIEYYCHEINLQRYDNIVSKLPDGEWKEKIIRLKTETEQRIFEVKSILEATKLPEKDRLEASLERIKNKNV